VGNRNANVKSPLEWVTDTIPTTDATVTNGRISLRLDREEVAEIRGVVVDVNPPTVDDAADDVVITHYMVSIDPDVNDDPSAAANREDLEVFMYGSLTQQHLGTTGGLLLSKWRDELWLPEPHPVLAGSDIGWVVIGDALSMVWTITVYLTRRKAKGGEKFNVLLTRR